MSDTIVAQHKIELHNKGLLVQYSTFLKGYLWKNLLLRLVCHKFNIPLTQKCSQCVDTEFQSMFTTIGSNIV